MNPGILTVDAGSESIAWLCLCLGDGGAGVHTGLYG